MAQGATIEQQVEGARFLLAVLTCWQFEYPLTEEVFVQDIQRCALRCTIKLGLTALRFRGVYPRSCAQQGLLSMLQRSFVAAQHPPDGSGPRLIVFAGGQRSTVTRRLRLATTHPKTRRRCLWKSAVCMPQVRGHCSRATLWLHT